MAHPNMGMRTARELQTLSTVLDYLARGRPQHAADVVAQRMKALEQSVVDGHWEKASFLELLEAPGSTLLNKQEEMLLAKELEIKARLGWRGQSGYGSTSSWQEKGGKKGDGWRQKGKGKKGDGKGKGGRKGKEDKEEARQS